MITICYFEEEIKKIAYTFSSSNTGWIFGKQLKRKGIWGMFIGKLGSI